MLTEWTRRETRLKGRSLIVKREPSGMYTDLWWVSTCTNIVWIHNFSLWKVKEECSNSISRHPRPRPRSHGEFRRRVPLLYKVTRVFNSIIFNLQDCIFLTWHYLHTHFWLLRCLILSYTWRKKVCNKVVLHGFQSTFFFWIHSKNMS